MHYTYEQLSETQQKILIIMPIQSALISILGSIAIIYLALQRRKVQRWTPYTRLLVAMSICDIAFSLNVAIGTFLRPHETSDRIWAFGNDSSCSFVGFMNQVGFAGIWYQGMLSIYFLLTARFRMKNTQIAKCIEPLMHFVALGYNFGAAVASIILEVYAERSGPISCYVGLYYGDSDGSQVERDRRDLMVNLFYKYPVALVTACLVCTQLSIYLFVRQHTRRKVLSSESSQTESVHSSHNRETSLGWSERSVLHSESRDYSRVSIAGDSSADSSRRRRRRAAQKKAETRFCRQSQRLWLVCTQAFLFVFSFLLCNASNVFMATEQSKAQNREEEMASIAKYFPVAVIQAILIPIQGLFNCLIFIRPKYMMLRLEFPKEDRRWIVRRIFHGPKLEPTVQNNAAGNDDGGNPNNNNKSDERIVIAVQPQQGLDRDDNNNDDKPVGDIAKSSKSKSRAGRNMMSSMTASDGDFDSVIDALGGDGGDDDDDVKEDGGGSKEGMSQPQNESDFGSGSLRLTPLEAIGEMSESDLDSTPQLQIHSRPSSSVNTLATPTEESSDNR